MHATVALTEADRLMTVCNSCRYCEGLCAVFPAMERRRFFDDNDLNYLANLCHNCGACYIDCQYSPPHEFDVNVPKTLAIVRRQTYAAYAWPQAFSGLFQRNGLVLSIVTALSVAGFLVGFIAFHDPGALLNAQNEGSFYALMPHFTMASLFGAAFCYALLAFMLGGRKFWKDISSPSKGDASSSSLWQAIKDACQLRYLDGGGADCYNNEEQHKDRRRLYHHLTFYGFFLCFASTVTATMYHFLLHREPPFPLWDIPVVLGLVGGIGLIIGPIGLLFEKYEQDSILRDSSSRDMETAFIVMLLASSVTGLLLLAVRNTSAMGITLAIHLGVIFSLFITMPYSKFVHGIYRFLALVRYAQETKATAKEHQPKQLITITGANNNSKK